MTTERQSLAFDHVGLNVADLEAATEWYCRTFALTPDKPFAIPGTDLRGIMLLHEPSGFRIELINRPNAKPGMLPTSAEDAALTLGYGHICLRVVDVRQEYTRLLEAGCSSRKEPMSSPRPGAVVSFVADPWGNLIEVINRD
ncbi:VOC family protein [Nocardioides mangrovi]|uniref:VOC family protein n=1 Tax=Nocardioides mangrovi TaxID=2874580 RepID=A0ABS7UFR5_9ACTN|nr:VOC family protein [Nocardioides mangrovi]MBZ5739536.1 VOC family protein [Nocardioides mangrovi]